MAYYIIAIILAMLIIWWFTRPVVPPKGLPPMYYDTSRGIAFGGGGTRCVAFFPAVMAGVMKRRPEGEQLNTYMNKYSVMSGNSGGAWFASLMTYSKNYYGIMNNRDIYEDCDNMDALDLMLTCPENSSKCKYGDSIRCCCDTTLAPSSDRKKCKKCESGIKLSEYIENMVRMGKELSKVDYTDIEPPPYLDLAQMLIDPFLTLDVVTTYALLTGNVPWANLTNKIVFDSAGDFHSVTVGSPSNGFTNRIAWVTGILNSGLLRKQNKSYDLVYNTTRPFEKYGFATPMRLAWDFSEEDGGNLSYHHSEDFKLNITYKTSNGDVVVSGVNLLEGVKMEPTTSMKMINAASGSAVGGLSCVEGVKSLINQLTHDYDIYRNESCDRIPGGNECGIEFDISNRFNNFATVMTNDGIVFCDDPDGLCGTWGDDDTSISKVLEDIPFYACDGSYTGDDAGVINAVYELQQKHPDKKSMKIVALVGYNDSSDADAIQPIRVASLFGKGDACKVNEEQNKDKMNMGVPGFNFFDLYLPQNQIFEGAACEKYKRIFNGVYDDPESWSSIRNCDYISGECTPNVHIDAWSRVTTIANDTFGIKEGYTVDLFVVHVNVSASGGPIFVLPTELRDDEFQSYYSNILNKNSEHIHTIIKEMPEDVYDVVFGDTMYNPNKFKHQDSWTNYHK